MAMDMDVICRSLLHPNKNKATPSLSSHLQGSAWPGSDISDTNHLTLANSRVNGKCSGCICCLVNCSMLNPKG